MNEQTSRMKEWMDDGGWLMSEMNEQISKKDGVIIEDDETRW